VASWKIWSSYIYKFKWAFVVLEKKCLGCGRPQSLETIGGDRYGVYL